jgi:hypothetical protein
MISSGTALHVAFLSSEGESTAPLHFLCTCSYALYSCVFLTPPPILVLCVQLGVWGRLEHALAIFKLTNLFKSELSQFIELFITYNMQNVVL